MIKGIWVIFYLLVSTAILAKTEYPLINKANKLVENQSFSGIDSMLIYSDNKLIFENYYGGFNKNSLHKTHSTFKSINALLALIAIDQRVLDENEFVLPLLKRFGEPKLFESPKKQILIKDLFNMTSGLDCDEAPNSKGTSHEWGVDEGPSPLVYSLNINMNVEPGLEWHYCSANSFLLSASISAALERANKGTIFQFAHQYLFAPLDIKKSNYRLRATPDGKYLKGQGNSNFTSIDLAKFGLLILNKGVWQEKRVVSEASISRIYQGKERINWSWLDEIPQHPPSQTLYGYQWYQTIFNLNNEKLAVYHSWGNGGQFIFVVPKIKAVAVFTGSNQGRARFKLQKQPFEILYRFVLPDLISKKSNESTEQIPTQENDGWLVAAPNSVGLADDFVNNLKFKSKNGELKELVSVLVAKDGKLVVDEYFNGYDKNTKHDIRSAGKSFTSTLVGLAIDKGLIKSENELVSSFISKEQIPTNEKLFEQLQLKHLLSMSSGFDANEDEPSSPGYEEKMYETDNWTEFALNVPFANRPGTTWAYASVNPTVLALVLENAVKEPVSNFADKHLFAPLQISDYVWKKSPEGRVITAGNLLVKARDMAKLGQLFLNNGIWNGQRIVSSNWVKQATHKRFETSYETSSFLESYGYLWWLHNFEVDGNTYPVFFASGNGGQKIYVVPDKKLVVAIQSSAYGKGWAQRQSAKILMSIISATNLKVNLPNTE